MVFEGKAFETIGAADLFELKTNQVAERKYLDYKKELPGSSDSAKKEFLADVSSFANASGGYIFFGIEEDQGIPIAIDGLAGIDPDKEILRLESILRSGIAPRIPGIQSKAIDLGNSTSVILMHIPRSWMAPHMVTFNDSSRFFSRASNGKFQLDVTELRNAFLLSETKAERIRYFRADRLSKIIAGETPVSVYETAKIVLHIVPLDFDGQRISMFPMAPELNQLYAPIYSDGGSYRYNIDGLLTYKQYVRDTKVASYLQLFRNGALEAVEGYMLDPRPYGPILPDSMYEPELIKTLPRYTRLLKVLGIEPPLFVMLSLVGVYGYYFDLPKRILHQAGHEEPVVIDRNVIQIPEIMLDSYNFSPEEVLRPCFDAIWNAAGFAQCLNYDEEGNRRERKR